MPPDTKERILDSAELLFAQHGIAATSVRTLTEHAGVNLASVNYHFQSKDALVQAVLFRRVNPINERRLRMLDDVLLRSAGSRPSVEDILDAFYRPPLEDAMESRHSGRPITGLLGRIYTEPGELLASQVRAMMAEIAARFLAALHLALPEIPQTVLFWRLQFSVGTISHTLGAMPLIEGLARGRINMNDGEEILRQMIRFAAGGLRGSLE